MFSIRVTLLETAGVLALAAGCYASGTSTASSSPRPTTAAGTLAPFERIRSTVGFSSPESAIYDASQHVWFVSNVAGQPGAKDHNGFISRLKDDGSIDSLHFIKSGVAGAVLDAPKGLALHGDTLWVADIDVARAFDTRSGRPLATVDFAPLHALMLNGAAVGPDGHVYFTDTAIETANGQTKHVAPDKIFEIGANHQPRIAVQDSAMEGADGISWDANRNAFLVVGFTGKAITAWRPGESSVQRVTTGPGKFDGCFVLPDGRALVSSWADSSLYVLSGASLTRVVSGTLPAPADLHVGEGGTRIAIPLLNSNEVVFYTMP